MMRFPPRSRPGPAGTGPTGCRSAVVPSSSGLTPAPLISRSRRTEQTIFRQWASLATYNSLDSLSNPRVGWFGSVDIGRQFGDADSWSLTIDGRRYQPLTARTTVSLVAFAAFQSGVVGRDLPQYMEFGIGGGNSVRGWELGSRVGKNQAIGTVE